MKILIANDSKVLTTLMRAIVETEPGYQILGTASDGKQAVEQMNWRKRIKDNSGSWRNCLHSKW
jgi:DNA-binding NarL/FixJ family response regulator